MTPRRVVLASTSPYRRALLARLGVVAESAAPGVDEDAFKETGMAPADLVAVLAEAKARAVLDRAGDALVVGADQCGWGDGAVLGKPGTVAAAIAQLEALAGREHTLFTAVCVLDARDGRQVAWVEEVRLRMRRLTNPQIAAYVERDRPLDCAGSYKFESLGAALFERVTCDDPTAIEGLPLMRLSAALQELGLDVLTAGDAG